MEVPSFVYKMLYRYISLIDRKKEILFMNYGYEDPSEKIELQPCDESNRYSIQLYHRLAKMVELKDKHIVEVGSGRGGGLAYITRKFTPATALGIDLDKKAAKFGNSHYNLKGLTFKHGNAHQLNLNSGSVDVIFNVESSHRYMNMELFLDEVYRSLKPGGYFMFTDFRYKNQLATLMELLKTTKFVKFDEQWINKQVLEALELDSIRRKALVDKYAPPFLRKAFHDFAGNSGSPTFTNFSNGGMVYFVFGYQKPY